MKFRSLITVLFFSLAFSANARPVAVNDEMTAMLKELFYECGKVSEKFVFAMDNRETFILQKMLSKVYGGYAVDEMQVSDLKSQFLSGEVEIRREMIGNRPDPRYLESSLDELPQKAAACLMI